VDVHGDGLAGVDPTQCDDLPGDHDDAVAETRRWTVTGLVGGWGGDPAGRAVRGRGISAGLNGLGECVAGGGCRGR
jgi:hypothetical protein